MFTLPQIYKDQLYYTYMPNLIVVRDLCDEYSDLFTAYVNSQQQIEQMKKEITRLRLQPGLPPVH